MRCLFVILEFGPLDLRAQLETLYNEKHRKVVGFFRERGFDLATCQELAQDTFVQAMQNLDHYRGEKPLWHWVISIANNLHKNYLRYQNAQKRREPTISSEDAERVNSLPAQDADPERQVLANQELERVKRTAKDLPKRMRQCFEMYHFKDRSIKEISIVLQCHPNTVKSQVSQALKRMTDETRDA